MLGIGRRDDPLENCIWSKNVVTPAEPFVVNLKGHCMYM